MQTRGILADAFGRIRTVVHHSTRDVDAEGLAFRVDPDANSLAWLVWHLTRVQDRHVARIAGREQIWVAEEWYARFGRSDDPEDTGMGHTSEQVATVRPPEPTLLVEYHDAVVDRTLQYLEMVDADELDRIIDPAVESAVTVGDQLVTVIAGSLQHAGQAAYVRGIIDRRHG